MSNILISPPPTTLLTGLLQLSGGVAISSTPVYVTDQNNTASSLSLSTNKVGIGTNNPTAKLQVNEAINSNVLKLARVDDPTQYFSAYLSSAPNLWDIGPLGDDGNTILRFYRNNYIVTRVGGTEYMRQESNGIGLFVGGSTPTARLQIKGSGSTNATSSIIVQNSVGTQTMQVRDDGWTYVSNFNATYNCQALNGAFGSQLEVGSPSASARVSIKGSGTTGSTFPLIIQNNAGNDLFKVQDDGISYLGKGSAYFRMLQNGNDSYIQKSNYATGRMIFTGDSVSTITGGVLFDTTSFGINTGTTTATATLQVKGSGSTSATSNLLVQNSSATQMFKITDDGTVEGGGATATQFKVMNQGGLAISRDASLDANIRIREFGAGGGPVIKMNGNSTPTFKLIDSSNFNCITSWYKWTGFGHTTVENSSAILQADSTERGFLPPRMTTAQKLAIVTPASGLQVYDTTLNQMSYYNGVTWINF